ncbi:PiggyBac transposable element-derived protein 2 [Amphibalanus amphitrite]|uniref:PiggyBac transposable element-derived protein 2 n=1 Tax=Amphibalanus amphitrite TaxID=1232801 RepID=A0A6A4VAA8_AMPAM|nr:PiggyBac transposable element-derived protein 2 [Amphibalanus amphitrite]
MVDLVVKATNKRLTKTREALANETSTDPKYADTDSQEIKAFIGLAYARGLLGQNHHSTKRVFHPQTGHQLFSATMSMRRFKKLHANLSFDDPDDRQSRWQSDRFAACRELFECFKRNCLRHVIAEEMTSLDETLYPTRSNVKFRQYNPRKPAKYGLLFRSVNAVTYPYTYVTEIYAGRPVGEPGPYYTASAADCVKHLLDLMIQENSMSGRNLTMDRLYTSIPLTEWMLERDITVVGTMNITRRGIPPEIKSLDGREDKSYVMMWEAQDKRLSLHSYAVTTKSSGRRNVLLLTSMNPIMGVTDDANRKPAIYKVYDLTKGGTDIVDQRMGSYTCKTKSRKWTMAALAYILDTCRVNAGTVMSLNAGQKPRLLVSADFGWELVMQLVEPHVRRRSHQGLSKHVQAKINLLLHSEEPEPTTSAVPPGSGRIAPRRCDLCVRDLPERGHKVAKNKMSKVSNVCLRCRKVVCKQHMTICCTDCSE